MYRECKCGNEATLCKKLDRVDDYDAKWIEIIYYCEKCNPDKEVKDD